MSREALKSIIALVPDEDIETLYKVVLKFIPEDKPLPDEIEAIKMAREDNSGTVSHDSIDWEW